MRKNDIIIVFAVNLLLLVLIALEDLNISNGLSFFRIILGLSYLILLPGYALQAALLPRPGHLSWLERLALSIGLSIAVMPILGLVLDGPPGGIFLWQSFIFLAIFTIAFGLIALYRRSRLAEDATKVGETGTSLRDWWKSQSLLGQVFFALIPVSVVVAGILTLYAVSVPAPGKQFTGFYVLGAQNVAANYPLEVKAGQTFIVKLGVENYEGQNSTFSIEARIDGQVLAATAPFTLSDGHSISLDMTLTASTPGDQQLMEILLLHDNQLYRRLYLWMNVESP